MIEVNGFKVVDHPPDFENIYHSANEETPKRVSNFRPTSLALSITNPKPMREPVIEGIARRGEVVNINAPPKANKSWLIMSLIFAIAMGRQWLNTYRTIAGKVLLVDNELHEETLQNRVAAVAKAMGIVPADIDGRLFAQCMRGDITDLNSMAATFFSEIEPGQYDVIILDAFYRFLPAGISENDNVQMTNIYNTLDRIAAELNVVIVLVHHTSKGHQGNKATTDVGSGAGSMARAADCHIALRPHAKSTEEEPLFVLTAAVRSFKPVEPVTLEFRWPRWHPKGITPELAVTKSANSEEKNRADKADLELIRSSSGEDHFNVSDVRKWLGCGIDRANRMVRELKVRELIEALGEYKRPRAKAPTEHFKFKKQAERHSEFEDFS